MPTATDSLTITPASGFIGATVEVDLEAAQLDWPEDPDDLLGGGAKPPRTPREHQAEAIEAVALGDKRSSRVVGRAIEDIDLPPGTTIPAIVRGEEVMIAHHDTVIEADDHVILFMTDRRKIERLEQLFQVGVSFV